MYFGLCTSADDGLRIMSEGRLGVVLRSSIRTAHGHLRPLACAFIQTLEGLLRRGDGHTNSD